MYLFNGFLSLNGKTSQNKMKKPALTLIDTLMYSGTKMS